MEVYMVIPSGDFLKPFTFGFNQVIADYFSIKRSATLENILCLTVTIPGFTILLDLVTTLDPQFIWPYYFGGIILSLKPSKSSKAI